MGRSLGIEWVRTVCRRMRVRFANRIDKTEIPFKMFRGCPAFVGPRQPRSSLFLSLSSGLSRYCVTTDPSESPEARPDREAQCTGKQPQPMRAPLIIGP